MARTEADLRTLSRNFLGKISELNKATELGIDDIALLPLIDAWARHLAWAENGHLDGSELEAVMSAGELADASYDTYMNSRGVPKRQALDQLSGNLDVFEPLFKTREDRDPATSGEYTDRRIITTDARAQSQRAAAVMTYVTQRTSGLEQALADAKKAAESAARAATLAEKAATEAATSTLERSFETTATNSARAAKHFRIWTIITLGLIAGLGALFLLPNKTIPSDDWHGVVYRIAVLSALAAVAAYLGRQASNYHRIATWALGIEIQLKAFPGFVNEIKDTESRQTMFSLFGKRVLEAPPDGKASNDEITNLIQPIIDQATKIRPN